VSAVGIDLGTWNSCVAICTERPEVVLNEHGDRTTPSVVAFLEGGKVMVGAPAWRQAIMNPRRTVIGVKRLVGRRYDSAVVRALAEAIPYEVSDALNGDARVKIGEQLVSPQEVQAYILEELRAAATKFTGATVSRAVVTAPAFFDEIQRQAVRDAAEIAGFESCRVLAEPTAAAFAYGYANLQEKRVAVVDLGGGTLDITVMKIDQGRCEVLATDGDLLLGGYDFDRALVAAFAAEIRAAHGFDIYSDPVAVQRLLAEAESAKRELSQQPVVEIRLPYLFVAKGPIDYNRLLTREEFEAITRPQLERIAAPCRAVLKAAGIPASDCHDVILVGGMTRVPAIQRCIADLFGRKPSLRVNPDEVVAMGAALLAADEEIGLKFVDVTAHTIGLRSAGDRMTPLIPRSSPIPAQATKTFATTQDQQPTFELKILQGENPTASQNRELAYVVIEPIPLRPRGEVQLRVRFEVSEHGGLVVRAEEVGSGNETHAVVLPASGLTRSEVEALAAAHRVRRNESEPGPRGARDRPQRPSSQNGGFVVEFERSERIEMAAVGARPGTKPPVVAPQLARAETAPGSDPIPTGRFAISGGPERLADATPVPRRASSSGVRLPSAGGGVSLAPTRISLRLLAAICAGLVSLAVLLYLVLT
jgi:molecular chaperone DnaK